ncbi:hypothetical protein [Thioalbus denitrificans]|uniref:dTDP-4-amino-4,6-dideoxygalactose transaminase n=1 Tax=Thioalbus denitrificans TaxID=547122 RepID=A0A369CK46_9GAMM|nr:hypothetical protein [Thioalbus denitrificans]RCX33455.1 hypothetical protein DFQ59_101758 [Thioalbus denitrificans]
MSERKADPIGGYFELELPDDKGLPHHGAMRFQSARAAFLALLRTGTPKKVWMPRYICDAMLAPLRNAQVEYRWYDLTEQLEVAPNVSIDSHDWLLYVDYFGICHRNVRELLARFDPDQVVLDYSQSFFSPLVQDALATIFSPRKFFGVPDGGLLLGRLRVPLPAMRDTGSLSRASHLLRRLAVSPEAGYPGFLRAEQSLEDCEPRQMSKLTDRILSSINYHRVSNRRRENFFFLHEQLGVHNHLLFDASNIVAPMCYPFVTRDAGLRERLRRNRIFVPTYWPEAVDRMEERSIGEIIKNLVPLPIDQRYGRTQMKRLVSVVLGAKT